MTFKCRRRANTAMPAKTAMPANSAIPAQILLLPVKAAMPAVRQKYTYRNMAESELLCVRVATLHGNKYKSDVIRLYMSELSIFLFYWSRYLPSHNYCPGKKKK